MGSRRGSLGYTLISSTCLVIAYVTATPVVYADPVTNDINYQGFSGLLNVPSGDTIEYGDFHLSYSSLTDVRSNGYYQGTNVNFSVSPFPGLEVAMRNSSSTESVSGGSDLAANFKYSPTFIPEKWFDFSVGALDVGGETGAQRAWFAALSRQFGDFRFTLGQGDQLQDQSVRRWSDGFYGVEYQPVEWATLVAENDGVNTNYGVKLRTPKRWLGGTTQIYASWLYGSDIEESAGSDEQHYVGVGVRTSMFSSFNESRGRPRTLDGKIAESFDWLFSDYEEAYVPADKGLNSLVEGDDVIVDQLGRLKRALALQGFENIWVGRRNERLFIRFENSVFNRNDIDALGVAMGLASHFSPEGLTVLDVNLSKYDVPLLRFEADLGLLKAFYAHQVALPALKRLKATREQADDMFWVGGSKSPYFVPRVSLSPKVNSFIGTELGMLDYSAAVTASFTLPIWAGLTAHADYDHNLYDTADYESGRPFWRYRVPTRWSNWAIKKAVKLPFDIYATVGVGGVKDTYLQEYEGVLAEGLWQSPRGTHQVSFSAGAYENTYDPAVKREVAVGRYRYYWEALDVSIEVEAGQYFRQDTGGKVEVAFNFGDSQMRFFAVDTDYQAIGVGWTVPIGLRRDMRPRLFQVKGADHWRYGVSTVVNNAEGTNPLTPGRVNTPAYLNDLGDLYFNGDRLSVAYIEGNAARLKDAYHVLVMRPPGSTIGTGQPGSAGSLEYERDVTPEELADMVNIVAITPRLLAEQPELTQAATTPDAVPAAMPAQLLQEISNYEYRIARGDVLNIIVYDHPELTNPAGSQRSSEDAGNTVENDGAIFYPHIGRVQVDGLTVDEAREIIARRLADFITLPQVSVRVGNFRSKRAYVTGQVAGPGPQPITNVPLTVLDAISSAGGLTENANWHEVLLSRDGQDTRISVYEMLNNGRLGQNMLLAHGDVLHVPELGNQKIFVLGELNRVNTIPIGNLRMSLTEALTLSGGLNQVTSNAQGIFVIRQTAEAAATNTLATVFQLDVRNAINYAIGARFMLQPTDIVYVTTAPVTRWNRVINQLMPSMGALLTFDRLAE